MADQKRRDYLMRRKGEMETERSSFISHWKELSEWQQPRRGRFERSDRNKGDKRNQKIINSIAGQSLHTARAGLMSGYISQRQPFFIMEPEDKDLLEFLPVQQWIYFVRNLMLRILRRSNFYGMTQTMVGEDMLFGTGCMSHVDDFETVARFYTHTIGSYCIAQDNRHMVTTICREWEWTVAQIVKEFGLENCSSPIRDQYARGNYGAWYPIVHFVEPNEGFIKDRAYGKNKAFKSCHFEPGNVDRDQFLRESGFDEFPFYVPRWALTGEDIYATDCPGMTALGDVKALQTQEKEKAKGIVKMITPPLTGPASLRKTPVGQLPGNLTVYDAEGQNQLRSIYNVNPQIGEMRQDIDAVERRIEKAFYVHLFRAISDMEGIQPRNELDLTKRDQERLLELGPVLLNFDNEFLNPLLDRLFNQIMRANEASGGRMVPPIPAELSEQELKWDYIGPLALAQKAIMTGPIERAAAFAGTMAPVKPDIFDKFDSDQAMDEYGRAIGLPPGVIVPDDQVAEIRQAREQAAAQAQAVQMAETGTNAVKNLSQADTAGKNALTDISKAVAGR